MSDWIVLGALTAITYAVSEAVKPRKPKPPAKPRNARSTTRHAATHLPTRTLHPDFPHRVPVQTTRTEPTPEAQNEPIAPRQRTRRGSGPFGMPQAQFEQARRNFQWSVGPETYDDVGNGWIEGLSEEETE